MDPAIHLALRASLALLFLSAAWHKARDLSDSRRVLAAYRLLPENVVFMAAPALAVVEITVAAALAWPGFYRLSSWAAVLLLVTYSVAIGVNIVRGRVHIDCGCGGPMHRQSIGPWLLVRNSILMVIAGLVAAEPGLRTLGIVDALTIAASIISLAALYAAADGLMATWPQHRRLRGIA